MTSLRYPVTWDWAWVYEAKQIQYLHANALDGRIPYLSLLCHRDSCPINVCLAMNHACRGRGACGHRVRCIGDAFDGEDFSCPVGKSPMVSGMVSSHEGIAVTLLSLITIPCTSYLWLFSPWLSIFLSCFLAANLTGVSVDWICMKKRESS